MEKLRIGMSQLIELESIEENVKLCQKLGLDFVELNGNLPMCQPETINVYQLNLMKDTYGIDFTFHLPAELDLGHFNRHIREAHLKVLEEAIGVADRLRCKVLSFQMNPTIKGLSASNLSTLYDKYRSDYLGYIHSSLELIDILMGGTGVHLSIEQGDMLDSHPIHEAINQLLESGRFYLTWGEQKISSLSQCEIWDNKDAIKQIRLQKISHQEEDLKLIQAKLELAIQNQAMVVIHANSRKELVDKVESLKQLAIIKKNASILG